MRGERFTLSKTEFDVEFGVGNFLLDNGKRMTYDEVVALLNEQQDQISYWKHKVNSLLWILGQFDKAKVKELLKELNNE